MKRLPLFGIETTDFMNSRWRWRFSALLLGCSLAAVFLSGATCVPPSTKPVDAVTPGQDLPADALVCSPACDNRDVCDGMEACVDGECTAGTPLDCDDGLFCTGVETCDSTDGCVSGGFPCGILETCDEASDSCVPLPELTAIGVLPKQGPASGGTLVTIEGTDFRDPVLVFFGDIASPEVVVLGSRVLTAISPETNHLRVPASEGEEVKQQG